MTPVSPWVALSAGVSILLAFAIGVMLGLTMRSVVMRAALRWYRMVVAAYAHGGGDGPGRDLVEDRGERARKALGESPP